MKLTPEQQSIREAVLKLCSRFDDDYWLERDRDGQYPMAFFNAFAESGWLGIALPQAYGGSGLGITEGAIMQQAIAESGAAMSGASVIAPCVFLPRVIVEFGTEEQKQRLLPPIIKGEVISAFAITEPNSGLDTTSITTSAARDGEHFVVNGRKVWTSLAQNATRILLLARTAPKDQCARPTDGMSLFYTELDRQAIEVREIEKMGRKAVDSNELFIDNLRVPARDLIGQEGDGFKCLLQGLNPERIVLAGQGIGIGRAALRKAVQYAKERMIFGRPIGQNQGIQHPLAVNWMELESANLMMLHAASLYDSGQPCGAEANTAKFLAGEAGFKAATQAVMTHGGYGYAKEFHVERYMRESLLPRIAPVTPELIKCFIAEKVLDLPRSY